MPIIFTSLDDPRLVTMLKDGAVGILPSDTVYGIVCKASNEKAAERLYALKDRHQNPGPVIAADADQLIELGLKRRYVNAVKHLWPNPISVEIYHHLAYLHQGTGRQAFRVVKDEKLAKLLEQTGPLLTTSANQPEKPVANTVAEAQEYFGDKVDFYVDGGDLSGRAPSTVIGVIDDAIVVYRQGAVKIDEQGHISS